MSESVPPLATAGEWQTKMVRNITGNILASVTAHGPHALLHIAAPGVVVDFDRAEALIPLINDALPDESVHKLRSRHVAAVTNIVAGYHDPEDLAVLDELASILVAFLPQE